MRPDPNLSRLSLLRYYSAVYSRASFQRLNAWNKLIYNRARTVHYQGGVGWGETCRAKGLLSWIEGQLLEISMLCDCKYTKITEVNWGLKNEYENDLRNNEHYLSCSENKA